MNDTNTFRLDYLSIDGKTQGEKFFSTYEAAKNWGKKAQKNKEIGYFEVMDAKTEPQNFLD